RWWRLLKAVSAGPLRVLTGRSRTQLSIVKDTMNRLPGIVLVTVVLANALLAQEQVSINPASIYHLGGVTIVSPNQPGWVKRSTESLVAFRKEVEHEVLNASVKLIQTKVFDNDEDLLRNQEALKEKEVSKLKKDSVHFNYVRFKAAPCVQYDGIFTGDASAPKFKYFNFRGYLCRSPRSKDMVVQIEFSNHSNRRAFSDNLFSLSDEFFDKIAFF
ncbi:MAG TPA: hypothetical protein VGW32_02145, partial [Pyrinomonadaceae bacterium]|nr:hypothetical protein [Pyrinomonadaceae bacterium]